MAAVSAEQNHQQEAIARKSVQVLLSDLKACSRTRDLGWGKEVHADVLEAGHDSNIYVANALISMYAKCGSMADARQVFASMKDPNLVSMNALISGYAENGQGLTALDLFRRMQSEGPAPNSLTFLAALKACSSLKRSGRECRNWGREIHQLALENGCGADSNVQNTLIDMYAKCGSIADARQVFDRMENPSLVSWTVLISGYAETGEAQTALVLFTRMRFRPDSVTYVAALKACSALALIGDSTWAECGRKLHNLTVENGCDNLHVQSALINMYFKCGNVSDALRVFSSMKHPDVVTWNTVLQGYAENGQGLTALRLFRKMNDQGPEASPATFVAVLNACISPSVTGDHGWAECKHHGDKIHNLAVENGCDSDIHVQSALINMYAKCGSMVDARLMFNSTKHPNEVSWTALILGYAENGQSMTALDLFRKMRNGGPAPNSVTFVAALKACTSLAANEGVEECRDRGRGLHYLAVENGCGSDCSVLNTLIDMYSKCGSMVESQQVFDTLKNPDVVAWTVLIMGYAENGQGRTALRLFTSMRNGGPPPNSVTFLAALKACAALGALETGKAIHADIKSLNGVLNVVLVNCLVDFYVKCGSMEDAQSVFVVHSETRNLKTYTTLLSGYSSCGDNESAFRLFKELQDSGFRPDGVTFLAILSCCRHSGLIEKGKDCFDEMVTKYDVVPTVEHYACMVDAFGRANKLDDAMALLQCMPYSPDDVTWMTVLAACRKWGNVGIGRLVFQCLIAFSDKSAARYVLMLLGQIYGSRGMLLEQEMVMRMRTELQARQSQAESCWIDHIGILDD